MHIRSCRIRRLTPSLLHNTDRRNPDVEVSRKQSSAQTQVLSIGMENIRFPFSSKSIQLSARKRKSGEQTIVNMGAFSKGVRHQC
jgi:hypothetical protein